MDTYNMKDNDFGIQSAPLSFLRGGRYDYSNGAMPGRGSSGRYWESQVTRIADSGYGLNFGSDGLNPQNGGYKGYGMSLRCIVRIPPSTYE